MVVDIVVFVVVDVVVVALIVVTDHVLFSCGEYMFIKSSRMLLLSLCGRLVS